jgi:carbamoyltransferase
VREHRRHHRELVRALGVLGLDRKLTRVEHHDAHVASAYLTSGFSRALAVTLDWYGGGLAGSVSLCTPGGMTRLRDLHYPHSTGLFYAQVTSALGFTMSQHEGKIVGLAAYGDPRVLGPAVLDRFARAGGDYRYRSAMDPVFARDLATRFPREHVAAAYQHALEVVVCDLAAHWLRATGVRDVVLAGGVAANVKMNQRVGELDGVERIFVHPNMGDGGTGVGATLAFLWTRGEIRSREWESCYLGPAFGEAEMEDAIRRAGLEPRRSPHVARDVAAALAAGRVVARFGGAMEYGPRALGNRSILAAATDPTVNAWLNRRLGRTEFMPFAPVTLAEHARERYVDVDRCRAAARFMTITCACTALMKRESPAAVHVDGTARPQLVRPEENPELCALLEAYHALTGIPTLINTSFNMHEEPIVCTPDDAVRAYLDGDLDDLSMGPFLVSRARGRESVAARGEATGS